MRITRVSTMCVTHRLLITRPLFHILELEYGNVLSWNARSFRYSTFLSRPTQYGSRTSVDGTLLAAWCMLLRLL